MADTMIAWRQERYGGPDAVHRVETAVPEPKTGEVRLRVLATGLNSADARIMRGEPLLVRLAFGLRRPRVAVQGRDVCGVVEEVGPGDSPFAIGDRVVGELAGGGLAEQVVAAVDRLVPVPATVDDHAAAALPLAGGTAWQALDLVGVRDGSRVIVLGAGGGVGTLAVRLAVLRGAEVHALCSPRAIDAVAALGPARVDDRALDLATLPAGEADAVIDLGGRAPLRALRRLLADGGSVVSVAGGEQRVLGPLGRMLHGAALSVGSSRRVRPLAATARPELTAALLDLVAAGRLAPVIDRVHRLEEADAALRRVDEGGVIGKVLVSG